MGDDEDSALFDRLHEVARREALPAPTLTFRHKAWLAFQRALDPLASPRLLRLRRRQQS